MAQPNNDFQFLDIERVDPPKRDMERRVGEFVEILQEFDAVILTEVYPAGEPRIIGADSASLVSAIKKNLKTAQGCPLQIEQIHFEKDIKQLPERILEQIRADDVVITMGAGSISAVPGQLLGGHIAPTP